MTPAALSALAHGDMENFLVAATPGGIEAQEARGQIEQSFKSTLPIDCGDRKAWEAIGVKFGEPEDSLFVSVEFPAGWRKQPTDHSMWTNLIDDKGRVRAGIFYKAAFYNRNAHTSLNRRFGINTHDDAPTKGERQVSITDGGKIMCVIGTCKERDYKASDKLQEKAREWLTENYPDHANPAAYWD